MNKERERQLEEKFNIDFPSLDDKTKNSRGSNLDKKLAGQNVDSDKNLNYNFGSAAGAQKIVRIEEEKERLGMFKEAMKRIKEATGVSDVNEIIQKFVTQEDTTNNLQELKNENDKKLSKMQQEYNTIKSKLETLKYEALESMTRKQVDEVQKSVSNL